MHKHDKILWIGIGLVAVGAIGAVLYSYGVVDIMTTALIELFDFSNWGA